MNRLFSFLLSCILLLTCTACVSPVSAANDGSDTPSHITPEHDEQLLHGSRPQLPSQSDPLPEKDSEAELVTPVEPEASQPSSQEPTTPDPVQPPTTDPESTDGTQTESTPVPESPRAIDPSKPMVALTFDDGPNATYSDMILDILEENNAVATFFEVGRNVANCPQPLTSAVIPTYIRISVNSALTPLRTTWPQRTRPLLTPWASLPPCCARPMVQ